MTNKNKSTTRYLIASLTSAVGVIIALLSIFFAGPVSNLIQSLGLALVVTGSVTAYQEALFARMRKEELKANIDKVLEVTKEGFDGAKEELKTSTDRVLQATKEGFAREFEILKGPGIYMLSSERRRNSRYHRWLLEKSPQKIFFAGHSILHRVEADFKSLGITAQEALKQKVAEGSTIRILFLDPTWSFLNQIAKDEGQQPTSLRTDLATTVGICKNLWDSLEEKNLAGNIEIRTCTELIQYAFHHVTCHETNEEDMLVGFYFAGKLGMNTPLFVVKNEQVKDVFEVHFHTVFGRAERLLTYSHDGDRYFNEAYYQKCLEAITRHFDHKARGNASS